MFLNYLCLIIIVIYVLVRRLCFLRHLGTKIIKTITFFLSLFAIAITIAVAVTVAITVTVAAAGGQMAGVNIVQHAAQQLCSLAFQRSDTLVQPGSHG